MTTRLGPFQAVLALASLNASAAFAQSFTETNSFIENMLYQSGAYVQAREANQPKPGDEPVLVEKYQGKECEITIMSESPWPSRRDYKFSVLMSNVSEIRYAGPVLMLRGRVKKEFTQEETEYTKGEGEYQVGIVYQELRLTLDSETRRERVQNAFTHLESLCREPGDQPF